MWPGQTFNLSLSYFLQPKHGMDNPSWHFVTQVCCEKNGDHVDTIFFWLFWILLPLSAKYWYFLGSVLSFLFLFSSCVHSQTSSEWQPDFGPWFIRPFWVCPSFSWSLVPLLLCMSCSLRLKCLFFPPPPPSIVHQASVHSSFKSQDRLHLLCQGSSLNGPLSWVPLLWLISICTEVLVYLLGTPLIYELLKTGTLSWSSLSP